MFWFIVLLAFAFAIWTVRRGTGGGGGRGIRRSAPVRFPHE